MLFPGRCSEVNHELWTCGLFSKFSGTYRLKAAFGHFKLVYMNLLCRFRGIVSLNMQIPRLH